MIETNTESKHQCFGHMSTFLMKTLQSQNELTKEREAVIPVSSQVGRAGAYRLVVFNATICFWMAASVFTGHLYNNCS